MQSWKNRDEFLEASASEYRSSLDSCNEEPIAFVDAVEGALEGNSDVLKSYPFTAKEAELIGLILAMRD